MDRPRLRGRDGLHGEVGARARRHPEFPAVGALGHRDGDGLQHGSRDQGSGIRDQGDRATGATPRDAIKVARYARGQDYHKVIEDRLLELDRVDAKPSSPDAFDAAHFVDKHQVQERVFAHHAGIGWIGKNSCVINPELGSWMFLSGIATSLDLRSRTRRRSINADPARSASTRVRPARSSTRGKSMRRDAFRT